MLYLLHGQVHLTHWEGRHPRKADIGKDVPTSTQPRLSDSGPSFRPHLAVCDAVQRQVERLLAERCQHHHRLQVVAEAAPLAAGVLQPPARQQAGHVRHRGARLVHLDARAVCQLVHQPQETGLALWAQGGRQRRSKGAPQRGGRGHTAVNGGHDDGHDNKRKRRLTGQMHRGWITNYECMLNEHDRSF